jgi:GDSL-like Lipase/Acylhydrolase family
MVKMANKNNVLLLWGLSRKKRLIWGSLGLLLVVLPASFFLWGRLSAQSYWFTRLFNTSKPIKLSTLQGTNIQLDSSGRNVVVSSGIIFSHGAKYTFAKPSVINLPPCPRVKIRLPLLDGKHLPVYNSTEERWQSAIRRAAIKCSPRYFLNEILVPGSVRIENRAETISDASAKPSKFITNLTWSARGEFVYGPDNMILINRHDRDFILPTVFQINQDLSRKKQATSVLYEAKTRRIDTLCLNPLGNIQLICGTPAEFAPVPPTLPDGFTSLANLMAPTDKGDLANADICPIQSPVPEKIDDIIEKRNRLALANVRSKLESGSVVKVLFYGDSITCGGSVMDPSKSFPEVFIKDLGSRYPHAQITSINKGLGETSCKIRYRRFRGEILSEKPDLIVIEFVNDYQLPPGTIEAAYDSILPMAKSSGAEVIFCTPHLLNPLLFNYSSWEQVAQHPYIAQVHALAKKYGIALCDVALRWQHCRMEGMPPDWLLTDKVIHINETGHKIYAEELLRCFD